MMIVMKHDAPQGDLEYVMKRAHGLNLQTHVSEREGKTLVGLLGDTSGLGDAVFSGLHGVERVINGTRPFPLTSIESKSHKTTIAMPGVEIGGDEIVLAAGPCSVESHGQVVETATAISRSGARMLRGGAFKPRSSPYSFQGLAEEGLKFLAAARGKTGCLVITEVMSPEQVDLVGRYADVFQIGTRNMQNYALLHAVGETGMPVLLNRGMMSTIEELLFSAEYILSHGNDNVVLCERGIRTFERYTRNTLDINAVPLLKELTHLPVFVDPSHATGKRSLVSATSKAAIAAGADGLLIEVHPDPDRAWSDSAQSLSLDQFDDLAKEVRAVAAAVGRRMP
jgi:3-deoxy-7-phosphoheptulonate synthase